MVRWLTELLSSKPKVKPRIAVRRGMWVASIKKSNPPRSFADERALRMASNWADARNKAEARSLWPTKGET